jgi:hypothetical protein
MLGYPATECNPVNVTELIYLRTLIGKILNRQGEPETDEDT